MRKKCGSLFLTLALLSCWSFGVSAEALQGKSGMKVSFDGRSMKANYKLADLTKTAVNLLPGDSVTYEMRLENESGSTAEMYMSNSVRKSMEDKGGAYTYDLRYIGDNGSQVVIYDNMNVGGQGGESLAEALNDLGGSGDDKYFYLDEQADGTGGTVRMTVALDGETQGNDYQDSLADMRVQFAAIETDEGSSGGGTTTTRRTSTGNSGGGSGGRSTSPVKTGDETKLYPYYLAAGISGVLLLFLFFFRRKKEEEEEEEA